MLFSIILSLCLLFQEDSYILVLSNGRKMEVRSAPQIEGRLCYVTLLSGERSSIPASLVDQEKTENYNRELRERREMAAAVEEAVSLEPEKEQPKKSITLRSYDELPSFDRSTGSVSGTASPSDAPSENMIGSPRESIYTSEDPVYLAKERIVRFEDHYRVECDVKVNSPVGAKNVKVYLRVYYINQPADRLEQSVGDGSISYGETAKVVFILNKSDDIIQTSYSVTGDVPLSP